MTILDYVQKITNEKGINKKNGVWFHSPLRDDTHPSFEVSEALGKFHDWGNGKSGDLYDLVMLIEHCNFATAKKIVGEYVKPNKTISYEKKIDSSHNTNKNFYHNHLIHYANSRCVSTEILKKYCYELVDGKYYYIALQNDLGGYAIRNEYFKGNIGTNTITTIERGNKSVVMIFEGMFDALSFVSHVNTDYSIIILNTTQNINKIDVSRYETIHLYLDNDESGNNATKSIMQNETKCLMINHQNNYKEYNDVNDFICNKVKLSMNYL